MLIVLKQWLLLMGPLIYDALWNREGRKIVFVPVYQLFTLMYNLILYFDTIMYMPMLQLTLTLPGHDLKL